MELDVPSGFMMSLSLSWWLRWGGSLGSASVLGSPGIKEQIIFSNVYFSLFKPYIFYWSYFEINIENIGMIGSVGIFSFLLGQVFWFNVILGVITLQQMGKIGGYFFIMEAILKFGGLIKTVPKPLCISQADAGKIVDYESLPNW